MGLFIRVLVPIILNRMEWLKERIATYLRLLIPWCLPVESLIPIVERQFLQFLISLTNFFPGLSSLKLPWLLFLSSTLITLGYLISYHKKYLVVLLLCMIILLLIPNWILKLWNVCLLAILQPNKDTSVIVLTLENSFSLVMSHFSIGVDT